MNARLSRPPRMPALNPPPPAPDQPLRLLGGLTPAQFMRRHWHKKPLLVRGALAPGFEPPITRDALFALAAQEGVESRLVQRTPKGRWALKHGPFDVGQLPRPRTPRWTLLVQGLNTHVAAADALLQAFRFAPDARLDDLMVSWASDGGGVGAHLDSYDVFLIQVAGKRRWQIGREAEDAAFQPGQPLKLLQRFTPDQEWVLEPGDLLYLPPMWAHDGVAVGECMTCSVGFRAPGRQELGEALLARLLDDWDHAQSDAGGGPAGSGLERKAGGSARYRDPRQGATARPAEIPQALQDYARQALEAAWREAQRASDRLLGEWLTEPKPGVVFPPQSLRSWPQAVRLHPASRMHYDRQHAHLNGESFRIGGRDATLVRALADQRALTAAQVAALSPEAGEVLRGWVEDGWLLPAG